MRFDRWRAPLMFMAGLESLLAGAAALFFLSQAGDVPNMRMIAHGMAALFAMFLVLGALPAFLLAWHGRFLIASAGLTFGAPAILLLAWRLA